MKQFVASFIKNTVLVNILFIVIILAGMVASTQMVREMFPEISVGMLQVSVAYPGTDPEEVEEGVSRKIEEAIDGIEGIKRVRTASAEGMSTTVIEVYEKYPMDKVYSDVRNAVDTISTFPVDAEKPILEEIKFRAEVINLTLWGEHPESVLKELAEQLKDELQTLPSLSQVSISGTRDYEIAIEISEEKLRQYGLDFAQVADVVRRGSLNMSGGSVRTRGEDIRIRTVGRAYRAEDFASIVVLAGAEGQIVRLGDIADIQDGFKEDGLLARFNGEPAVLLSIFKTSTEDAIAIVEEVDDFVAKRQLELPQGVHLTSWADQSVAINARISLLLRNGAIGLALVFFSLWIFMDLRLSFWVTMGIPISLSGGLLLMYLVGASLNMVSLFGLIMVLGIVVDDAIIVGEAIYVHRRNGEAPMRAALEGVMEVGLPVLAAVTTSIIAFMPLLFVSGVMGKFVEIIPVTVIATLVVSLVESIFLLPAHLSHLPDLNSHDTDVTHSPSPRPRRRKGVRGLADFLRYRIAAPTRQFARKNRRRTNRAIDFLIHRVYEPIIKETLHYRYIAMSCALALLIITIGLVAGKHTKFTMFPDLDVNDVIASIELPNGTPFEVTREAVEKTQRAIDRVIARLPDTAEGVELIQNVYAVTGESGGDEFERRPGANKGYVRVELIDGVYRDITAQELMVEWEKEIGPIPGALSQSFLTLDMGPPGAPIEIALRGNDMDVLLEVSAELQEHLRTYEGVYQVQDSFRPGKNELRIDLKPEARTLGLTLEDMARQVNAGFYGQEPIRLQRGRDDIRVKVRYPQQERASLAELERIRIRTPSGSEIPFMSVADIRYEQGYASVARLDGAKTISITAEVDTSQQNAAEVLEAMRTSILPELERDIAGWTYKFDGMNRQTQESFSGLMLSFPIAVFGIYLVIASIFRSYIQPLVILVAVPFGIIGAIAGHIVMGFDLSMFSIFGMVALTGVVVNDAIVLIEAVNHRIANGSTVFEAIAEGGVRRFRAIMLTSISTVGGLLPLILEQDVQAQLIIPMALSIAGGVLFATVLTLVFIPCLLGALNDLRRLSHLVIKGRWPTREEVEPARLRRENPLLASTPDAVTTD